MACRAGLFYSKCFFAEKNQKKLGKYLHKRIMTSRSFMERS